MTSIAKLEKQKGELKAQIAAVNAAIEAEKAKTHLTCRNCSRKTMIKHLTFIPTKYSVRPSGCMEGDYWCEGSPRWACNHCGDKQSLYGQPEVQKLRHLFKKVAEYERI